LLAYLALHPQKHARDALAGTFWGEYPEHEARMSLRTTLSALRDMLGDDIVIADMESVRLNPTFPLWVDAVVFEGYARQFLAEPPLDLSTSFLDLYQGDLLPGIDDAWIAPTRERLRSFYLDVLQHGVQYMRARSRYGRAVELAQRVLALDPGNERAHQQLMFCYIAQGDRSAALKQYSACINALDEEMGVPPAPETTALYHWIMGSQRSAAAEARITNVPLPLSSFVGREKEMADVKRLLARNRLLTIAGPGGSGKSRLAIQVATDLVDSYKDGVWFIDLTSVQSGGLVAQAVGQVLGVVTGDPNTATQALCAFLQARHLLLLLDNCEHLIDGCAQVANAMLSAAPGLRILATSREPLMIAGEVTWSIPSLSVPPICDIALAATDLGLFEATLLFVERARRQPHLGRERRGCSICSCYLQPARWHAPRYRAGCSARQSAARARDRQPPWRALPSADILQPHSACPSALATGDDRLELQPAPAGGANAATASIGLLGRIYARSGVCTV
jgi:DNA-binding SARP family transcriptional activator